MTRREWRLTKRLVVSAAAGVVAYLIVSVSIAARGLSNLRLLDFHEPGPWWG